jgi:Lrp/AsnC family leucine-responsive transcriptional regulator
MLAALPGDKRGSCAQRSEQPSHPRGDKGAISAAGAACTRAAAGAKRRGAAPTPASDAGRVGAWIDLGLDLRIICGVDLNDSKIIRSLMMHGRMTNARLARDVGLSESATLERVRRLEASGVIEGYTARVEPESVGRALEVFMTFTLKNQKADEVQRFVDAMSRLDEVLSCAQVLGRFDFIAHVAVRDVQSLERFLNEKLIPLGIIDRMESLTVLKMLKRSHPPFPFAP